MENSSILTLLRQDGPFATGDEPPGAAIFSAAAREFTRSLRDMGLVTRYRVLREQICSLMGTADFAGVHATARSSDRSRGLEERACLMLGRMFGFSGRNSEIIGRIKSCSVAADSVIRFLRQNVLKSHAAHVEMTNEIDVTSNPAELLLITFDPGYHKKARFEAKRKLILMLLAGAIEQRERETGTEQRFAEFLGFLNDHVWSPATKIGELDLVYIESEHRPDDFSCTKARVISPEEAADSAPAPLRKLTLVKRRRFTCEGRDTPIHVSIRKKGTEAKILKLLRKGRENPALAVDDELGLMAVVDSLREVKLFQKHLADCASRAGSFLALEDISDTLTTGSTYESGNTGSATATAMLKFFARMGGMRVEFIIHTNRSYLDYIYRRDVAHDEYEIRRLFDTGVISLLFPEDIYRIDHARLRAFLLEKCRERIEAPSPAAL